MPEEGDGRRRRTAASRRRGGGPAARHRRPVGTHAGAASASGGAAAAGGTAAAYWGAKRQGWAAATARPAIGSRRSIRSVTGSPLRYPRPGRARPGGPRACPLSSPFSVDCGGAVRLNERVAERAARLWACRVDPLERSGRLRARRVERRGRQRGIGSTLLGWDSARVAQRAGSTRCSRAPPLLHRLQSPWSHSCLAARRQAASGAPPRRCCR